MQAQASTMLIHASWAPRGYVQIGGNSPHVGRSTQGYCNQALQHITPAPKKRRWRKISKATKYCRDCPGPIFGRPPNALLCLVCQRQARNAAKYRWDAARKDHVAEYQRRRRNKAA